MGLNSRYEIRVKGILDGRWTAWFALLGRLIAAQRAGRRPRRAGRRRDGACGRRVSR